MPPSIFASWLTGSTDVAVEYFEKPALPPATQEALAADSVCQDAFTKTWTDKITSTAVASPFWQ